MFTGIISDIGTVQSVQARGDLRARISCALDTEAMAMGASVACDGVCLTVVSKGKDSTGNWFEIDASAETLARSTLSQWAMGHRVNLERPLKLGDELGGHIVSGHVDGLAKIVDIRQEGDSTRVSLTVPDDLARFIAPKGSVALNGTSLTVNSVEGSKFDINLIPHTKTVTTWGAAKKGDMVNLEIDTLARYVARLAEAGTS